MKTLYFPVLFAFFTQISNSLYAQSYSITPWANNKKAAVTVTFDDNTQGQFLHAVPVLNEKAIKATFFINARTMDWNLAKEAINAQHEIGNHTVNHKNLILADTAEIHYEVKTGYDIIKSKLPSQRYVSFSYPGGQGRGSTFKDDTVRMFVKKYHINGRGIRKSGVGIGPKGYDSYNEYLNPLYDDYYYQTGTFSLTPTTTIEEYNYFLNQAIAAGGWFTPLYHGIEVYGNSIIPIEDFIEQMNLIKSKEEDCWITTYGQATCYHKERRGAVLEEISFGKDKWVLALTDNLDDEIYQEPLTIRLFVPDSINVTQVTQSDVEIDFTSEGDTLQFNAVPDGGDIILKRNVLCSLSVEKSITLTSIDNCTGKIRLNVSGGVAPYQVSWENLSNDLEVTNLCVGWYQYSVTDANDCQLIDSAYVSVQNEGVAIEARGLEAIIFEGKNLNKLNKYASKDLVGFRYESDQWHQIPIQIDEKDSIDGRTLFGNTPAEDFPELAWGKDLEIYKTLAYCDSNTWVGLDHNPKFDYNDELVFMFRDAGSKSENLAPEEVDPLSGVEISLSDPLDGTKKYVYIFEQTGSLDQAAGQSYVQYNFNLYSGSYKETYKIGEGPNPENTFITTPYYQQHFSDRFIRDELKIFAGGSSGIDILDRHRNILDPVLCYRSEDSFSSGEGAFQANINGPIRAIRSYYGANSGPLLQRDHFFYAQKDVITTRLQMHGIKGFLDLIDYSTEATGMSYRNDKNPQAFQIDGIPDEFDSASFSWEQTSGPHGTWISFSDVDENMGLKENTLTFREDENNPINVQCTGDSVAFGTVGLWINQSIPNTDPRNYSFKHLTHHRTSYFFGPEVNDTTSVAQLVSSRENPLVPTVSEWNTLYPQPSGIDGMALSAQDISLKWTDTHGEIGYTIRRAMNDTLFVNIASLPEDSLSFLDTWLLPSQTYSYQIQANYIDGNSSWSNSLLITTASDTCLSPKGLESVVNGTNATLSWQPAINATIYKLEIKLEGKPLFDEPIYTREHFHEMYDLEMDTTYIWQVSTICDDETSFRTQREKITVGTPYSSLPPVSPSNLEGSAISTNQIHLTWQDNSPNDTGFLLERSTTPDGIGGIVQNSRLNMGRTNYLDRGLSPNTTYYYRIKATNSNGDSDWSNQVEVKTLSQDTPVGNCEPPTALTSQIITETSATLSWTSATWADDYQVFYKKVGEPTSAAKKTRSNGASQATIHNLSPNTKYEWAVKSNCNALEKKISKLSKRGVFTTLSAGAFTSDESNLFTTSESLFSVFPNPSDGKVNITYRSTGENTSILVLYNSQGKEIYYSEKKGAFEEIIDLSKFGGKLFIAKIISKEGSVTKQIIIR